MFEFPLQNYYFHLKHNCRISFGPYSNYTQSVKINLNKNKKVLLVERRVTCEDSSQTHVLKKDLHNFKVNIHKMQ